MNNLDIIKGLAEYYNKSLSDNTIRIYVETLSDIPPEILDATAKEYIKEGSPFMPKVAELRRMELQVRKSNRSLDVLQLIPGAAQTEADLDKYGTVEEHLELQKVLKAERYDELTDRQEAILSGTL